MTTRTFRQRAVAARLFATALRIGAAAAGAAMCATAMGGETDLSSMPLITSAPQVVKPNLMFILDDSGSMAWSHMPDDTDDFGQNGSGTKKYGYASSQCNGVYYNPSLTYSVPPIVAADGTVTYYPNASFTGAWTNGYNTGAGTTDLSTGFRAWTTATVSNTGLASTNDTAQAAYYYTYSGAQLTAAQKNYFNTSGTFYLECSSLVGSTPGSGVFTKVVVSSTSGPSGTDERQNFANWYSYYRTRMLMMKTSTGLAFRTIGDQYRVGYMSINNNVDPSFLNIGVFNGAQKNAWYSKLYGAIPDNSTPLRESLSNAGRMFAKEKTTMYGVTVTDPVEYSCQKNFALLSTDGYWNGNAGFQVDGTTAIGNQDSASPRPYSDGGTAANVYTATLDVDADSSTDSVTSITVNGAQILSSTADASGGGWGTRATKLASKIVSRINACTGGIAGSCTVAGYSAVRSGSTITITAPSSAGAISATPVVAYVSSSGTVTAFSGSTVTTGGTADTLADVAMYYYNTDLRATGSIGALGNAVDTNNVLPGGDDDATWQHMTTFTLGLGARGQMIYSPTYKSDTTGDFPAVKNGSLASSSVCTWQTTGTVCNWPTPGSGPENIDDLWHAAVNGRGQYFSATDSASLATGLNSALLAVTAMTSDSAAATTSNPNVTAGDNYLFSSTFRSAEWYGELELFTINPSDGVVASSSSWKAGELLDANTTRTIHTFDATSATKLKSFLWANLLPAEQAYFTTAYMQTAAPPLNQFCVSGTTCLSAATQTAAGGAPLVNFLRGERTNEGSAEDTSKYFRQRAHVLGDIVNSEAVYVKGPVFDYVDIGYAAFKTTNASRTTMVYVGGNDGMLHAFNATNGQEAWAYIPSMLLPKLYRLADKFYSSNHQFYVDGSPTVGDVRFADGTWHTILVGGLNGGGRGYYALDITTPASPKALWEFSTANSANLGFTYGRPEITKLANGTWTVMFTSGYNNVNPGDGKGYLYVINAETGLAVHTIGTGEGSDTGTVTGVCATAPCPSGLAQIRAWVNNTRYDNTTTKVYGGDLYGNLWRFDVNNTFGAAGVEAQLLASLRGPSNAVQSITAKPELGNINGLSVVFVGTGRYLGGTDLNNTEVQSIYAIKDSGGSTSVGNPRSDVSATGFVQQTLTVSTCGTSTLCVTGTKIRTLSTNPVNFATQKGWFVDLPGTGERANTDPQLSLGTLAVVTNILDPSACSVGGESYINFFDYRSGQAVPSALGIGSVYLGAALGTRPNLFKTTDGKYRWVVDMSDTSLRTGLAPPPSGSGTRRTSWRELIVQ